MLINKQSITSNPPPKAGRSPPESFTCKSLFKSDSVKSPIIAAKPTTNPNNADHGTLITLIEGIELKITAIKTPDNRAKQAPSTVLLGLIIFDSLCLPYFLPSKSPPISPNFDISKTKINRPAPLERYRNAKAKLKR